MEYNCKVLLEGKSLIRNLGFYTKLDVSRALESYVIENIKKGKITNNGSEINIQINNDNYYYNTIKLLSKLFKCKNFSLNNDEYQFYIRFICSDEENNYFDSSIYRCNDIKIKGIFNKYIDLKFSVKGIENLSKLNGPELDRFYK